MGDTESFDMSSRTITQQIRKIQEKKKIYVIFHLSPALPCLLS